MSFGFGVSDFITVTTLAWNIYNTCKNSPGEFRNISSELASLHIVLQSTADHIAQHGMDQSREAELGRLKTGCRTVLEDIQKLLIRYGNFGAKKQTAWQRVRWGMEDISGIRSRLTSNVTLLTAFNSNLTNSSQARIETKLDQLMAISISDQPYGVTLSPNRASEDIRRELPTTPTKEAQSLPLRDHGSWEQRSQSLLPISKPCTLDCKSHRDLDNWVPPTRRRADSGVVVNGDEASSPEASEDPHIRAVITQGGSKFNADVKGKDVTQGSELEISVFQARHHYIQEGSEFGGSIQASGSVVQGNKVRI